MGLQGYGEVWGICVDASAVAPEWGKGEGCDGGRGNAGFPLQS